MTTVQNRSPWFLFDIGINLIRLQLFMIRESGVVLGLVIGVLGFVFYDRPWLYAMPLCRLVVALAFSHGRMPLVRPASSGKKR